MSYRHFAVRCILVQGLNIGAAPFIRSLRFGSSFKNIFFCSIFVFGWKLGYNGGACFRRNEWEHQRA